MRVDSEGVGIDYEVTGEGPRGAAPRLPRLGPAVAPPGARRWSTPASRSSSPTCGATGSRTNPTDVDPYNICFRWPMSGPCSTTPGWNGRMWSDTTGARPWPGCWPPWPPNGWTISPRCRSATHRPSAPSASSSARSRGTCCSSSSRASPSSGSPMTGGPTSAAGPTTPTADGVIAALEATGSLTPGLNWYRANIPPESYVEPPSCCRRPGPHHGRVEPGDFALTEGQMRARPSTCRALAVRAARGAGPLDAARGAGGGQRAAAGLPAALRWAAEAGSGSPGLTSTWAWSRTRRSTRANLSMTRGATTKG